MKRIVLFVSLCGITLFGCAKKAPDDPATTAPATTDEVQLSQIARKRFDLTTAAIVTRTATETMSTTGEIKADENKVFHINSLTNGRVQKDYVNLGDEIRVGQTLAVIENLEVVKIYAEYIHQGHKNTLDASLARTRLELAKKTYERVKTLYNENIAPEKDVIKAESDLRIEQQTVDGLKVHAGHLREETKALLSAYGVKMPKPGQDSVASTSPIISPKSGVITKKNVTVGDVVTNTEPLYIVADLSKVWLDIAVYDKQLSIVKQGSMAVFTSDSLPGQKFKGRVGYIQPSADDNSGTFLARVELPNPAFTLKPGMLGQVTIENPSGSSKPFIPEAAIQREGNEVFVFIDKGGGKYKKRLVTLGSQLPDGYLAKSGVSGGDTVVTNGSFALKAEMLKSSTAEDE